MEQFNPLDSMVVDQASYSGLEPTINPNAKPQREAKWSELYQAGVENNHIGIAIANTLALREHDDVDENFTFDIKQVEEDFSVRGIPMEWAFEMADTVNETQYHTRLNQLMMRADNNNVLDNAGGKGLLAQLASAGSDPIAFAIDSTVGMGASKIAMAKRMGKLSTVATTATATGGSNAAIGAIAGGYDNPDYSMNNALMDFAGGVVFGGVFGAMGSSGRMDALTRDVKKGVMDVRAGRVDAEQFAIGVQESMTRHEKIGELSAVQRTKLQDEIVVYQAQLEELKVQHSALKEIKWDAQSKAVLSQIEAQRSLQKSLTDGEDVIARIHRQASGLKKLTPEELAVIAKTQTGLNGGRGWSQRELNILDRINSKGAHASKLSGADKAALKAVTESIAGLGNIGRKSKSILSKLSKETPDASVASPLDNAFKTKGDAPSTSLIPRKEPESNISKTLDGLLEWNNRKLPQSEAGVAPTNTPKSSAVDIAPQESALVRDFAADAQNKFNVGNMERYLDTLENMSRNIDTVTQSLDKTTKAMNGADRVTEQSILDGGKSMAFGDDTLSAARAGNTGVDRSLNTNLPERGAKDAREALDEAVDELSGISDGTHGTWLDMLRIDMSRFTDKLSDVTHRAFMRKLTSSAVGVRDGAVNTIGAVERTNRHRHTLTAMFQRGYKTAFDDWMRANNYSTWNSAFALQKQAEFSHTVGLYKQGRLPDAHPSVVAASRAMDAATTEALNRGIKRGVAGWSPDRRVTAVEGYMPRSPRHDLLDVVRKRFSKQEQRSINESIAVLIERGLAGALMSAGKEVDAGVTSKVAAHYAELLLRGRNPSIAGGARTIGQARMDYLDEVLIEAGVDATTANRVLNKLDQNMPSGSSDTAFGNLRARLDMDLNESIILEDGSKFTLGDLFETNSERLVDDYIREASGHIGLAEVGFRDARDARTLADSIIADAKLNDGRTGELAGRAIDMMFKSVMGQPIEEGMDRGISKATRMVLDWNFLRTMGSIMWSMLPENGKVLSAAGWHTSMRMIPELGSIIKEVTTGTLEPGLARELASLSSPGTTMLRTSVNLRPDDFNMDSYVGGALGKLDRASQVAKRVQFVASGLGAINDAQSKFVSRAFMQNMYDFAKGAKKMDEAMMQRLRDYGMSDKNFEDLMTHMRTHAKSNRSGVLQELNVDAMDVVTEDILANVLFKHTRHVIQEADIGATPMFMHSTLGRVITQFRAFGLASHTRHMLYGLSRHDATAFKGLMYSMPFAMASYAGRAYLNTLGEPEKREYLLDPQRMMLNSFAMTADSSLIPMIVDTIASPLAGGGVFQESRSSQLSNNVAGGIPTVATATSMFRAVDTISKGLGIQDAMTGSEKQVTKQDVKDALGLLWLSKLNGVRQGLDAIANEFPDEREVQ